MQPIVIVTDPEGHIEAFSSVQLAIEENNFDDYPYRFYWAQGPTDLHRDSARGMSLPEIYLMTRYNPERLPGFGYRWLNRDGVVLVAHPDSPTKQWTMQFTYLYV